MSCEHSALKISFILMEFIAVVFSNKMAGVKFITRVAVNLIKLNVRWCWRGPLDKERGRSVADQYGRTRLGRYMFCISVYVGRGCSSRSSSTAACSSPHSAFHLLAASASRFPLPHLSLGTCRAKWRPGSLSLANIIMYLPDC